MPNEKFPNGGAMSQYVNSLNVGDKINVLGPRGKIMYKGMGKLTVWMSASGELCFTLWLLGEFNFQKKKNLVISTKLLKLKMLL